MIELVIEIERQGEEIKVLEVGEKYRVRNGDFEFKTTKKGLEKYLEKKYNDEMGGIRFIIADREAIITEDYCEEEEYNEKIEEYVDLLKEYTKENIEIYENEKIIDLVIKIEGQEEEIKVLEVGDKYIVRNEDFKFKTTKKGLKKYLEKKYNDEMKSVEFVIKDIKNNIIMEDMVFIDNNFAEEEYEEKIEEYVEILKEYTMDNTEIYNKEMVTKTYNNITRQLPREMVNQITKHL
jgi:hypothetical protein